MWKCTNTRVWGVCNECKDAVLPDPMHSVSVMCGRHNFLLASEPRVFLWVCGLMRWAPRWPFSSAQGREGDEAPGRAGSRGAGSSKPGVLSPRRQCGPGWGLVLLWARVRRTSSPLSLLPPSCAEGHEDLEASESWALTPCSFHCSPHRMITIMIIE